MARINDPYELLIGTAQLDRLPDTLDPESERWPKIDDRSTEDLMRFAGEFSKIVRFYNRFDQADGNWENFFDAQQDASNPHYALFLAFLESYKLLQREMNGITARHLDCLYRDALGFRELPARPDRVHILFELAKNRDLLRIAKGTRLNAGKDSQGRQIVYRTDDEIVVNRAEIASVKSLHLDRYSRFHVRQEARKKPAKDADGNTVYRSWPLFGESLADEPLWTNPDLDYELGFAIANQNFACAEGERIISLLLSTSTQIDTMETISQGQSLDIDDDSLQIYFSGAENWIGPFNIESDMTYRGKNEKAILLHIKIPADAPAITAYRPGLPGPEFNTSLPVMRVMVNPRAYQFAYPQLFDFTIRYALAVVQVGIDVSTANPLSKPGIKQLKIKNDQGLVDPANPVQLFGTSPALGSEVTIGCPEVFEKDIAFVIGTWEWSGMPLLESHYRSYGSPAADVEVDPEEFTATVSAVGYNQGRAESLAPQFKMKLIRPALYALNPRKASGGFFKLVLDGPPPNRYEFTGFGHEEYSNLLTSRMLHNSKFSDGPGDTVPIPNKPWAPKLRDLTLRYFAMSELLEESANPSDFFHITPFGFEQKNINAPDGVSLLPRFVDDEFSTRDRYGMPYFHLHYFALKNVSLPQKVSILYQFEEGSGDSEAEIPDRKIRWYFLGKDGWIAFGDSEIGPDSTSELLASGIVSFNLTESAVNDNPLMPAGYYWIRAVTDKPAESLSRAINLHGQAVGATYIDPGSGTQSGHYDAPLTGETISKLMEKNAAIKKLSQPYASFGGVPREATPEHVRRVSEQLRHRQRGSDRWDYEHIVLQQFPSIYKLKCLNYTDQDTDKKAGTVSLVAVPDLEKTNVLNRLEPKLNSGYLRQVERFVARKKSLFVDFLAQNPLYERIRVHADIRFHQPYDPGLYTGILNNDLIGFLAPWVIDGTAEITFGGVLYRSQIIDFIEERHYVDKVKDLWIEQIFDHDKAELGIGYMVIRHLEDPDIDAEDTFVVGYEVKFAKATTARSVLTSASNHDLKIWQDNA